MTFCRSLTLAIALMLLAVFAGTALSIMDRINTLLVQQWSETIAARSERLAIELGPALSAASRADVEQLLRRALDAGDLAEVHVSVVEPTLNVTVRNADTDVTESPRDPKRVGVSHPTTTLRIPLKGEGGAAQLGELTVKWSLDGPEAKAAEFGRALAFGLTGVWLLTVGFVALLTRKAGLPLRELKLLANTVQTSERFVLSDLPKTPELRRIAEALGEFASRLAVLLNEQTATLEKWRERAFQDPLTGLENRLSFTARLREASEDQQGSAGGCLILFGVEGFAEFNRSHGREAGDTLLRKLSGCLQTARQASGTNLIPARLDGASFGVLGVGMSLECAEQFARSLVEKLSEQIDATSTEHTLAVFAGVAPYVGQQSEVWFADADAGLREAVAKGLPVGKSSRFTGRPVILGGVQGEPQSWWTNRLENRFIQLNYQALKHITVPFALHYEVFARFTLPDGTLAPAGYVLPTIQQLGKGLLFDKLVIESLLMTRKREAQLRDQRFAVNLSVSSIMNTDFRNWFKRLAAIPEVRDFMCFEFAEPAVLAELPKLLPVLGELRAAGVFIGVDHFGAGFGRFSYLERLRPHYVKIDGGYIRGIAEHQENYFYVRSLAEIAHSLGIQVYATSVENASDLEALRILPLDGVQGNAIEVAALKPITAPV